MECRRGLAMIILSLCLSARLSNTWIVTSGRKIGLNFYAIIRNTIYPCILNRRMVGGATPCIWNFGSTGARWSEIADFEPVFARSASAVTTSIASNFFDSLWDFSTTLRRRHNLFFRFRVQIFRRRVAIFSHFFIMLLFSSEFMPVFLQVKFL